MGEQEKELRMEGVVRAAGYSRDDPGKPFLGAILECSGGDRWVIDYDEQSPFHAFADRRVVVSGETYEPQGQHLGGTGHLRVSTVQLAEVTPDAQLMEVGAGQKLSGRFEHGMGSPQESSLIFVTDEGDRFSVFNEPAGLRPGRNVEVWAYPVKPAPAVSKRSGQWLWILCPCSSADLWEWRARRS